MRRYRKTIERRQKLVHDLHRIAHNGRIANTTARELMHTLNYPNSFTVFVDDLRTLENEGLIDWYRNLGCVRDGVITLK